MSFIEELKNNRDKQIMAISIVFFVLSFPAYFYLSAQGADDFSVSTAVATYEIDGERQYFELTSGDEFVVDAINEFVPCKVCIMRFRHIDAKIISQRIWIKSL